MDLNAITMFHRVVKAASFSRAAAELGVTKSTISKKVSELETELGTTLLRRTTRSLQLTEMGQRFYDQSLRALNELKEATEAAQATGTEPRGVLRITTPSDFAPDLLSPMLTEFMRKHPKVSLQLVLSDKTLDFVRDNIDVAIRLGKMTDSALKAKKVGRDIFQLVASPEYLKQRPAPTTPEGLHEHACLLFLPVPELQHWELRSGNSRVTISPAAAFSATSVTTVKSMVMSGAGIALLPLSNCCEDLAAKKLKVVLPEWRMDDAPVHLVYQAHHFVPPKIQAFVSFMEAKLKKALPQA